MGLQPNATQRKVPRFITWTQAEHQKQFVEISYARIGLSIADITVV
jgi:hypothetical protein